MTAAEIREALNELENLRLQLMAELDQEEELARQWAEHTAGDFDPA